ncbi:MAG: hypothetical protein ABFS46_08885, partial [Myxococcota bacterium]
VHLPRHRLGPGAEHLLVMVLGYSILAVPTGIVTAEIVESAVAARRASTRCCAQCMAEGHEVNATFCKDCGAALGQATERS